MRKALFKNNVKGYRLHRRDFGVRADISFVGKKIAVFLDGCFWHGCPECFKTPKTRTKFWIGKISANIERDARNVERLQNGGWTVLRFWEHEIKRDINGVVLVIKQTVGEKDFPGNSES